MTQRTLRIEVPEPGGDLSVKETTIPECPPKGLVIKTHSSGICHTDVHFWMDKFLMHDGSALSLTAFNPNVKWPLVLGHEICGEVYAIGSEVVDGAPELQLADVVTVYPWNGCGECGVCQIGDTNICPTGGIPTDIGGGVVDGGYQSYVVIADRKHVVKLPSGIPSSVGCMFACSALTAYHACSRTKTSVERAAKAGGAKFLVIGAGGLGLWCIQIAKAIFPSSTKVFVADISEDKLNLAKEYGADETILWPKDVETPALIEKTKAATGGIDGSVDFVGRPSTVSIAYESTNKGATMSVVGAFGGTFAMPILQLVMKDITMAGTFVGTQQQMVELIDLFQSKKLRAPPVEDVTPEEVNDAIHKLQAGQITGRAVINFK